MTEPRTAFRAGRGRPAVRSAAGPAGPVRLNGEGPGASAAEDRPAAAVGEVRRRRRGRRRRRRRRGRGARRRRWAVAVGEAGASAVAVAVAVAVGVAPVIHDGPRHVADARRRRTSYVPGVLKRQVAGPARLRSGIVGSGGTSPRDRRLGARRRRRVEHDVVDSSRPPGSVNVTVSARGDRDLTLPPVGDRFSKSLSIALMRRISRGAAVGERREWR